MKRLGLVSIVASVGAYAACGGNSAAPSARSSGGAANLAGDGGAGEGGSAGTNVSGTGTLGGTGGSAETGGSATQGGDGGSAGASVGGTTTEGGSSGPSTQGGRGGSATGGWSGSATQGGTGAGATGGAGGQQLGGMGGNATGGMLMGGGGGRENTEIFSSLHGQTILMSCGDDTSARVCTPRADDTRPCISPPGGPAAAYAGTHWHNEQVTVGGTPGIRYVVTLRVRGLVEAKTYAGGMDQSKTGEQVPADGLYIGGSTPSSGTASNYYFIRSDSPAQHYYLNSIGTLTDSRVRHSVFEIDFTFEMPVDGGSTVCLVAADPTPSAIKNCADPDDGRTCSPVSLSNLDPLIAQDVGAQPHNGQFIGITVVSARRM